MGGGVVDSMGVVDVNITNLIIDNCAFGLFIQAEKLTQNINVNNFKIKTSTNDAIRIAQNIANSLVSNIKFVNGFIESTSGRGIMIVPQYDVDGLTIKDVDVSVGGSLGIQIVNTDVSPIKNVKIFNVNSTAQTGISLNHVQNLTMRDCVFSGSTQDLAISTQSGANISNVVAKNSRLPLFFGSSDVIGNIESDRRTFYRASAPLDGTFNVGDRLMYNAPTAGGKVGMICTTAGTNGTLSSRTGTITTGTNVLVVNNAASFYEGNYITIAGVTGVKKITNISGTAFTLDSNVDATVTDATVQRSNAVFKSYADISA